MNWGAFGISAGALMRAVRTIIKFGQGATQKFQRAVVLEFDRDSFAKAPIVQGTGQDGTALIIALPTTSLSTPYPNNCGASCGPLIIGPMPDNGVQGGAARGYQAIEITTSRNAVGQVASGANSVAIGGCTTSSNSRSTAIGNNASATNSSSTAIGDNATVSGSSATGVGSNATASGTYGVAVGYFASANAASAIALGGSSNCSGVTRVAISTGSSYVNSYTQLLQKQTADDTPATLTTEASAPSASNINILVNNSAQSFRGRVIGTLANGSAACAFEYYGAARREATAASIMFIGAPVVNTIAVDAALSGVSVALVTNTSLGGVTVVATGLPATTIKWASVMYSEYRTAT